MSDQDGTATASGRRSTMATGGWLTAFAAAMVVILAVGSILWPDRTAQRANRTLLVYDSSGSQDRISSFYEPLREFLSEVEQSALNLVVVRDLAQYMVQVSAQPDFVFAPDGIALDLSREEYVPLLAGRRGAPQNLRPRGVLVSRRSAGEVAEPWLTRPSATVLGDSVSLVATGVLRRVERTDWPSELAFGPDPYDHGPVLHALRLGAFDFAVVRQWDAERFLSEGLLDPQQFMVREVIAPVPDTVLMAARQVPQAQRLQCGERLSALGRRADSERPLQTRLQYGLSRLRLVGFNLLLEPEFELIRRKYPLRWPSAAE